MGDVCTRRCRFCGVQKGIPAGLDNDEPRRIALAASAMNLRHIVITSVTRDDLPDGGAGHFAATILACRTTMPESTVEVLVPDFNGDTESLDAVLAARPDVLNHNIETVPRLYETIRPGARYGRSLKLLNHAAQHSMTAKSGIMAGLGESEEEVADVLNDLRLAGCSIVTIGQYLQPSDAQVPAAAYVSPEQFEKYERIGRDMGFAAIVSGPLVRSSYRAGELCAKQ
jgi:lipoic acid synthetase